MNKRVFLVNLADFPTKGRGVFNVEGTAILVAKTEQGFYAISNKCPHMGLPLAGGKVEGNTITCPFHGSRFDLGSGENLDWVQGVAGVKLPEWSRRLIAMGKQPNPVTTYPVVIEGDKLYVEL